MSTGFEDYDNGDGNKPFYVMLLIIFLFILFFLAVTLTARNFLQGPAAQESCISHSARQ